MLLVGYKLYLPRDFTNFSNDKLLKIIESFETNDTSISFDIFDNISYDIKGNTKEQLFG